MQAFVAGTEPTRAAPPPEAEPEIVDVQLGQQDGDSELRAAHP